MRLSSATVCLDCEEIFQAGRNFNERCPECGSRTLQQLNRWVNENQPQNTPKNTETNSENLCQSVAY